MKVPPFIMLTLLSSYIGLGDNVKMIRKWYPLMLLLLLYGAMNLISHPLEESILVATEQPLNGLVIVVDAGHGGKDNGASANFVVEDQLNLEVAMALKDVLELAGAEVVLTREADYDLASTYAKNRKKEDLKKRVEMIEEEDVVLFISIHMNTYENSSVSGAQVFYRVSDEASKALATLIQQEFKELMSSKLASVGNYYILNESTTPGVLVECGFMSNSSELVLLQESSYQTKIAYAIYRGIVEYVKQQYTILS